MFTLIITIKMKFAMYFISLIIIYVIPRIKSQDSSSSKVPGCSSCLYYGSINEACQLPTIPISNLPKECTSIIFMGTKADNQSNISDGSCILRNEEYFQNVVDSGKPSFIHHAHADIEEWSSFLDCNAQNGGLNVKTEMQNLKNYLDQYSKQSKPSGIILSRLSYDPEFNSISSSDLTANFKVYLDELRLAFPDYGIGVDLIGRKLMKYYDSQGAKEWLDFTVLDSCIDFYTINLFNFNRCTEEFKIGGTTPVNGDAYHTLENLVAYTVEAGIPKIKTYFAYGTEPRSANPEENKCNFTKTKFCASPTLDGWCSDNTQSYYEKGQFAKDNGAGFVALNVDFADDPNGCCNCGRAYPGFYDILDGFNGAPIPESCALLDKN